MNLKLTYGSVLLLAACAGGTAAEGPSPEEQIVGGIHPPLPAGYVERSSLLLDDGLKPRHAVFEWRRSERPVISLARATDDSVPHWRTVSVLTLPVIAAGDVLVMGACSARGVTDRRVIAIAERTEGDSLKIIRRAWRADTARDRFENISRRGVVCENEGED
jgi:hypothetical protein